MQIALSVMHLCMQMTLFHCNLLALLLVCLSGPLSVHAMYSLCWGVNTFALFVRLTDQNALIMALLELRGFAIIWCLRPLYLSDRTILQNNPSEQSFSLYLSDRTIFPCSVRGAAYTERVCWDEEGGGTQKICRISKYHGRVMCTWWHESCVREARCVSMSL